MSGKLVTADDLRGAGDLEGVARLLSKLGYDTASAVDQTGASLGVAERQQAMIRHARRLVAEKLTPDTPALLEIYLFEVNSITAELRKAIVAAFRHKPARVLFLMTTRDFDPLDFVLVEQSAEGSRVAVSHQLFSVDRRHPSQVHLRVINRLARADTDALAQFDRMRDAFRLAQWSQDEFNNRNLFSDYFLKNRLTAPSLFPVWSRDYRPAYKQLREAFSDAGDPRSLSEGEYHEKFVLPIVRALGFSALAKADGQTDYLLSSAQGAPPSAALLVYPWDRPLDRKDDNAARAHAQDVPGIRVVKVLEEQKLPWAILTNGKDWRLYCAAAHSRATNYYEIDLPDALGHDDLVPFRYFYLFFRAESFASQGDEPSFLDQILDGSASFAKELGDRLRKHVFDDVFPYLAQGFVDYRRQQFDQKTAPGDEFLTQTYDATLTLLYRLLFLLFAESLDLLPVNEPAYAELSLARLKHEIARDAGDNADLAEEKLKSKFNKSSTALYDRLTELVGVIDIGSKSNNVPAYNGGLFSTAPEDADTSREADAARFLQKFKVPDFYLARALDLLARSEDSKTAQLVFVDYKSLGVRQLGSIYEGLLMYHVVLPRDDWEKGFVRPGLKVALVPSNKQRKSTGSYFTPQHIVKYIVTQTVGPLLEEKFKALATRLRAAQREYHEQKKFESNTGFDPSAIDPRTAEEKVFKKYADTVHDLLDVKVLDPAVGSGHFLVETVDFITDKLLEFIAGFPWNPLQVLVDRDVRGPIVSSLDRQGVKINEDRLTDVNLIKRLVMKRCVYGVDLNPMAVELAKVSVWLDSFTIGAPLSFMDHHFKCGNSLIGSSIAELKALAAKDAGFWTIPMEPLEAATLKMELVANYTDVTVAEVHESAAKYHEMLESVKGYRALLDCITAEHFGVKGASSLIHHGADIDIEHWDRALRHLSPKEGSWVEEAEKASQDRRFFHWDIDFPDVFFATRRSSTRRTFDAAVGNPPYDRLIQDDLGPEVEVDKRYFKSKPSLRAAASKEMNLWRLFICAMFGLPSSVARLGFIVPLGLLGDDAAEPVRRELLTGRQIEVVEAFPQKDDPQRRVFEEAKLSTVIVIVRAEPPREGHIVRVRTHEANIICKDSSSYTERQSVFFLFEPQNVPIPRCSHAEWRLARRLAEAADSGRLDLRRMVAVAHHFEGEVPQKKPLGIFVERESGEFVIRGANIARYSLQDAKQGEDLYVDVGRLRQLFDGEENRLAHVQQRRVVYQEGAPEDNYRRVIPCLIEPGSYVGHTVHYVPEQESSLPLEYILAVLGSSFSEWFFDLLSANNHVSQYKVHAFPVPIPRRDSPEMGGLVGNARDSVRLGEAARTLARELTRSTADAVGIPDIDECTGSTIFRDPDYLGIPRQTGADFSHEGVPAALIARVYPSYPLPGIDTAAWEAAAWEEFCDFLRKNKGKIGNARIRADLTGRAAVTNPTGPMKKLQETFLHFHRQVRENRAKAAELDFLIDRIVFKLFDLTLEEQKLILSRVGPGRPLPPRRGKKRAAKEQSPT